MLLHTESFNCNFSRHLFIHRNKLPWLPKSAYLLRSCIVCIRCDTVHLWPLSPAGHLSYMLPGDNVFLEPPKVVAQSLFCCFAAAPFVWRATVDSYRRFRDLMKATPVSHSGSHLCGAQKNMSSAQQVNLRLQTGIPLFFPPLWGFLPKS